MKAYKKYSIDEAKAKLEGYCAYQERCHKEVQKKLYEMRMIPEAIDIVIGHLLQHNFLNETRFSQAFARGKFRSKKWGKRRITNELKMRAISKYNIALALKEIPDSEYFKTFDALSEKRLGQLEKENDIQKKRKKLADYLLYRGWDSAMVYEKVKELVPY